MCGDFGTGRMTPKEARPSHPEPVEGRFEAFMRIRMVESGYKSVELGRDGLELDPSDNGSVIVG